MTTALVKAKKLPRKPAVKAKTASANETLLTFLLDESGSMGSVRDDTIGGFNTYMKDQRKLPGKMAVTLIKFDTTKPFNIVYDDKPLKDVEDLTHATYVPNGGTPLLDTAYKALIATEDRARKRKGKVNVVVVIQTDGHENASVEHNLQSLKSLIEKKQGEGWAVVFIGAGIDAYAQAASMGVIHAHTSSYSKNTAGSNQAFTHLSEKTMAFRSSGATASMNYSDADRKMQGDTFYDKNATKAQKC